MKDKYIFKRHSWNESDYRYIYSPNCRSYKRFIQEEDCISNRKDSITGQYDYVSMITKKEYHTGAVFTAHCSFEKYGAPLIVITNDLGSDENGELRYGRHIEVVAYENGVNVWYIEPAGGTVKPINIIRRKFEVPAEKVICLTVRTEKDRLLISLDGVSFTVAADCIPEKFYAGITACEGINRFYDFTVEE